MAQNQETNNYGAGGVAEALNAVLQAFVNQELAPLRKDLKELESSLFHEIRSTKSDMEKSIDALKKELTGSVTTLTEEIDKERSSRRRDAEGQRKDLNDSVRDLGGKVDEVEEKLQQSLEAARSEFEKRLQQQQSESAATFQSMDNHFTMLEEQQNADRQKLASFFSGFVQNFMGGQSGGAAQMAEGFKRPQQAPAQEQQAKAPEAEKKQPQQQPNAPKAAKPAEKEEQNPQEQDQSKKKNEQQENGQQLPAGSDFTKSIDDMFKL